MLGSYAIMRSDSVISDNQDNSVVETNNSDNNNTNNVDNSAPKEEIPTTVESASRSRINWTDEETEKFKSLRAQFPDMSFEVMQERHFPDRSVGALRGKHWRITADAEANKKRKRSASVSSSENPWAISGDIPFETSHPPAKQHTGLNPGSELGYRIQRNSLRRIPRSTTKPTTSSAQLPKQSRHSLPGTAAGVKAPATKPSIKKAPESPIELSDHDVQMPESKNNSKGDNRVQLALQLLDPKLWNQIYHEARKCESERRRADSATREKAALETELREVKLRLKKMEKYTHKSKPNQSKYQASERELDPERAQTLKAAWDTVSSTCRDYISFTNWQAAGMSEAMKVVESEIEEITKAAGSESPSSPFFNADGDEHDDTRVSMMGNLQRLFDET